MRARRTSPREVRPLFEAAAHALWDPSARSRERRRAGGPVHDAPVHGTRHGCQPSAAPPVWVCRPAALLSSEPSLFDAAQRFDLSGWACVELEVFLRSSRVRIKNSRCNLSSILASQAWRSRTFLLGCYGHRRRRARVGERPPPWRLAAPRRAWRRSRRCCP